VTEAKKPAAAEASKPTEAAASPLEAGLNLGAMAALSADQREMLERLSMNWPAGADRQGAIADAPAQRRPPAALSRIPSTSPALTEVMGASPPSRTG